MFFKEVFRRLTLCHSLTNKRWYATGSNSGKTVVQSEIEKFNERADRWWDENGASKPLHLLNNIRVPFIRESILGNHSQPFSGEKSGIKNGPYPLKGCKLIDVGCGAGILSEALAKIGAEVTGLDAGEQLISVAREHAALTQSLSENLRYVNVPLEDHTAQNHECYDALVCSEVLEHVEKKDIFVEQCAKLVKPGGSLIFTTINQTLLAGFLAIFMAEYVLRVIPKGTHFYRMLVPDQFLENELKLNNCDVRRTEGCIILPGGNWIKIPTNAAFYAVHAVKVS